LEETKYLLIKVIGATICFPIKSTLVPTRILVWVDLTLQRKILLIVKRGFKELYAKNVLKDFKDKAHLGVENAQIEF